MPGRSRDLLLSEACLVGPALATFIAALSVRYHVSRAKIREFLAVWFGVPLSIGVKQRYDDWLVFRLDLTDNIDCLPAGVNESRTCAMNRSPITANIGASIY